MGGGPARCRKCASGYTLTGSKCLGKCTKENISISLGCNLEICDEIMSCLLLSLSDVDECSDRVLACHGLDEICTNTEGSFRCDCAEGFIRRDSVCVKKQQPSESRVRQGCLQTQPRRCLTPLQSHVSISLYRCSGERPV